MVWVGCGTISVVFARVQYTFRKPEVQGNYIVNVMIVYHHSLSNVGYSNSGNFLCFVFTDLKNIYFSRFVLSLILVFFHSFCVFINLGILSLVLCYH